jgi:two-component system phosphate regulon sensor histidine kinase PhoR
MGNAQTASDTATPNDNISKVAFQRFVLNNLPCAVITVDSDLKISFFSPWAEKLTGYSSQEVMGRYCGDILKGGMCPSKCPLKGAMQGAEQVVRIDTTIQNKHGETIPVRMNTAALLNDRRQLVGGVEALQDISHLRALERERANLISMIAHDIKTPIVTIGGFARRLLKKDKDISKERKQQYVEIISREATEAERLVNEFLELSRLEVGALTLSFGPTSVNEILIDLLKTLEPKALTRGIKIEIAGTKTLSVIEADATRLRRVFSNLLDNALKFSKDKSKVTIDKQETDREITVKVTDQGIGIDAKDIPYIFDPFNRAQGEGKRGGFGLGLAIVKAIVRGHGGRVHVESELGRGSVFSVILPKKPRQRKDKAEI